MRHPRLSAPLRFAVLALIAGAACSSPAPSGDPGADLGTSAAALTGADAIARAEQWVSAQLLYCQSPNHASDTIDPACPAVCNRTDNPAWDPYRSDCSGLVSWAWGLPAPGHTTYGFAPFATDITTAIQASALAPGDAVNNSDHVMLFKAWAGAQATFIEEPGCSANPDYAHELTSAVTLAGTQITVAYNGMTFTAIHFDELGPSCTNACDNSARVALAATPTGEGYWIADSEGHVYPDGNARFFGDLTGVALAKPVVGVASTPSGSGYWLVAADGGVFSFGDAGFHGSAGGMALNEPVVGMARTPDGGGYWLAAGDGGVFSYGDAAFYGSAGSVMLNKPVVGIASTPTGKGYWMVAADGGIFNYGDAGFFGSAGSMMLNKPIVGMAPTSSGKGYWLVASDGGIFSYGDAVFHGSAGGMMLNQPVVGMSATGDGGGYWMVASDGGVFTYGDAAYLGNGLASGCNAGVPQQCALASTGCFALQNDAACPAGQVCGHGTCQATCTDACTAGTTQCSGAAAVQVCGSYGSAPCTAWSEASPCPAGQSCAGGVCKSPTCSDDCEPGATECQAGSLLTCTGQKTGGCHTWGAPTPCMAGQVCQAGGCAVGGGTGGSTSSGGTGGAAGAGGGGTGNGGAAVGQGSGAGTGAGSVGSHGGCAVDGRGDAGSWGALALVLGGLGVRRRRRG